MPKLTRKCQYCGVDDTHMDEMEFEIVGNKKKQKKYYHKDCYQKYLKEKEFKQKEREELDKLVEVIKDIYGVKNIPNSAYPYLQDLRNGTKFFGKFDYKYKKGYSYSLIADTFEYCSDTIQYWNRVKKFDGFVNALRYGLAIVCDKIHIVEERNKEREYREVLAKKKEEVQQYNNETLSNNYYKKKHDDMDISDLLEE